jgi:predicted nucleic acid-binding protein
MRPAYFDASAIVKLSNLEAESQALIDYLDDNDLEVSTSIVGAVEVRRALRRLRATRSDSDEAVRGFYFLALTADISTRAADLGSATLRTLDALHLATALAMEADLDFVTYDDRLAAAAREAGLRVVQPGRP